MNPEQDLCNVFYLFRFYVLKSLRRCTRGSEKQRFLNWNIHLLKHAIMVGYTLNSILQFGGKNINYTLSKSTKTHFGGRWPEVNRDLRNHGRWCHSTHNASKAHNTTWNTSSIQKMIYTPSQIIKTGATKGCDNVSTSHESDHIRHSSVYAKRRC
jgi:hypothetical protein